MNARIGGCVLLPTRNEAGHLMRNNAIRRRSEHDVYFISSILYDVPDMNFGLICMRSHLLVPMLTLSFMTSNTILPLKFRWSRIGLLETMRAICMHLHTLAMFLK